MELDVGHPALLPPEEGEIVTDSPERRIEILAEHDLAHVTWTRYAPGERGPDLHVHRHHADAFYVLEGELVFELGPDATPLRASAGTLVLAPALVIHSFRHEGRSEARFLNIHAPGCGFARSLREQDPSVSDTEGPPEDGARLPADAVVRGPGEGERLSLGASSVLFKVQAAGDGDGTFSLMETTLAPGFPGPVLHRHERLADSFFVLEGTLHLRLGEQERVAPAGSFAFVPPGMPHTFSNPGSRPARVLNLMAPAGFEQYFKEAARLPGPPDPEAMAEIASRYDFQIV